MINGRTADVALALSSLAVVAVAAAFDVLAGQRPDHTMSLILVAAAVGVTRWMLRGRLRGLFSLINLGVVAQPVAHGLTGLTQTTAGMLPHGHDAPGELSGLAVQIAVALLVVVVAGSEPIAVFVTSTVLAVAATLARGRAPDTAAPVVRRARPEHEAIPVGAGDAVYCPPHRGPPPVYGLTV